MTTSRATMAFAKPTGDERVPRGTQIYFRTRNKNRAYTVVMKEFQESGLSQRTLARRLGMDPSQMNRYLTGPGNWTLDTLSDLLFAINGGEPEFSISYPLDKSHRNDWGPEWLKSGASTTTAVQKPAVVFTLDGA